MQWILGSASPRRRELLANLGLRFDLASPQLDEEALLEALLSAPGGPPDAPTLVRLLAEHKAQAVLADCGNPDALIVAADTMVFLRGVALGKPHSRDHARAMLESLSGQEHEVCTGFALLRTSASTNHGGAVATCHSGAVATCHSEAVATCHSEAVITRVRFRTLSKPCIEAYLDSGEYRDKAGAYGIQGLGGTLVERLDGCYFNVVGLPVMALCSACERLGFPIFAQWNTP